MKKGFLNITISILFLSNVLFTQIIANFLHNHTEEKTEKLQKSDRVITKAHPICQICALHFFHELFYSKNIFFSFSNNSEREHEQFLKKINNTTPLLSKGRSPPVFSLLQS